MSTQTPKTPNPSPFSAQASYGAGYGMNAPQPTMAAPPLPPAAGAPSTTELVFDVSEADFEARVLEASLDVPVLLDCWAPWCGPCRSLGPVLEKVVQSLGGQVLLAKINTDEAPNVSAALRMRSIPLVVLFIGGRPVDQFVGALPEGQIREFLKKHLGELQPQGSPVDELRKAAAEAADAQEAEELLAEVLTLEPTHAATLMDLAERHIGRGELDAASKLLERVNADARGDRHPALLKRIELAKNRPPGNAAEFAARIAANSKDFEARFGLAALQVYEGDYNAAFDELLEVVMRDKGSDEGSPRQRARKQLVEWFAVCPDADAVSRGRRYLGMYLN